MHVVRRSDQECSQRVTDDGQHTVCWLQVWQMAENIYDDESKDKGEP